MAGSFQKQKHSSFWGTQENLVSSLEKNRPSIFLINKNCMLLCVKKLSKVDLNFRLDLFSRLRRCFSVKQSKIRFSVFGHNWQQFEVWTFFKKENKEKKMSTTSQKHRNFIAEPMSDKPVTVLAGMGKTLGQLLVAYFHEFPIYESTNIFHKKVSFSFKSAAKWLFLWK